MLGFDRSGRLVVADVVRVDNFVFGGVDELAQGQEPKPGRRRQGEEGGD